MLKRLLTICLVIISLLLIWLNVVNYRNSRPLADNMLFGIAHSIHAAIEFSVYQDPSLRTLSTFHSHDIVSFALVDEQGVYQFNSNSNLVGARITDSDRLHQYRAETMTGKRIRLANGVEAYEIFTHIQSPKGLLGLELVLHTRHADDVTRSARMNMMVMVVLLLFSWFLAGLLYRYSRREDQNKLELSRQENLAQIGEMGAMLAHEIRNPLAGIKGFAQLIEKKPEDPRTKDSAGRIITETLRLEELTTDLLAFARNDNFPVVKITVTELIEQTVLMLNPEVEHHDIKISMSCEPGLEFCGNRDRMSQVLLNIVGNALQSMSEGGILSLSAKREKNYILLSISDSGHGITPLNMLRVFDPFFTTKARGTGLGLALCKKIIEEHGGTIDIESSEHGTTVTIKMPKDKIK